MELSLALLAALQLMEGRYDFAQSEQGLVDANGLLLDLFVMPVIVDRDPFTAS